MTSIVYYKSMRTDGKEQYKQLELSLLFQELGRCIIFSILMSEVTIVMMFSGSFQPRMHLKGTQTAGFLCGFWAKKKPLR